ncbi:Mu transposase C-terminal domain-containing protein [Citrobacter braakii]|uniref:Mu transposase C-terminal domain-containing protein n=1 Tax=Citrobacter braakii TaxID=57706 RepID=UPI003523FCD6
MYLTVRELIGVPGLPNSTDAIRNALNKLTNDAPQLVRKRDGTKAREYHIDCLPSVTKTAILDRACRYAISQSDNDNKSLPAAAARVTVKRKTDRLSVISQCPALITRSVEQLTALQKNIADARSVLVVEVLRIESAAQLPRIRAINYICEQSRSNALPEHLQRAAEMANARKGNRTGVSPRTLNEWVVNYLRANDAIERLIFLSPGHNKMKKPDEIKWLPVFMTHFRSLNGPSINTAYHAFKTEWYSVYADQPAMIAAIPSIYAVRRALNKMSLRERMRGRVSGSAARSLEVYQRRDWSQMPVNGCWISDGKSLNMKVAHPIHGQPFTPELTLVIDGRTRYLVGWSLSLSENQLAVADAYRHGIKHHGKPLFVYSDNGGGEKNKMLDADITGIFPRLGITHMTGIPGNPQARGIIERLNGVIPRSIAQQFATYNGHGADREHVRMTARRIESAINATSNGRELTPIQSRALSYLPSWGQLLDAIEREITRYNTEHEHSQLPKISGRHMTPAEYRAHVLETEGNEIEYLSEIELREMFMPEQLRIAQRGYIQLLTNTYYAPELINVDGEQVRVAFDIHDGSRVYIRKIDGTFICEAVWDGNLVAAVPVTAMQTATEQRRKRRINRVDNKRAEIEAEARPVLEAPAAHTMLDIFGDIQGPEETTREYHFLEADYPAKRHNRGR